MFKLIAVVLCMLTMSVASNAFEISASYLTSTCIKDDATCASYLKGVFDGARAVTERGKETFCPNGDIDGGQLKRWFLATMEAARKSDKYKNAEPPAATMALASFIAFMPCN